MGVSSQANSTQDSINGYDLVIQCLKSYGIDIIYGFIGIPVTQLRVQAFS